jgi:hypothetical protein
VSTAGHALAVAGIATSLAKTIIAAVGALVITAFGVAVALRMSGSPNVADPKFPFPISSISGIALEKNSNQPVPGIELAAYKDDGVKLIALPGQGDAKGNPIAITDAQGRYHLSFMADDRTCMQIRVAHWADRYLGSTGYINLYQGETRESEPLLLASYATVRGRVLGEAGEPIAGAAIRAHPPDKVVGFTDQEGYFTDTQVLPYPGRGWSVTAAGFTWRQVDNWIPGRSDLEIRMTPCQPVAGTVMESDGKPAARVRVFFYDSPSNMIFRTERSVVVDDQGSFVVRNRPSKALWLIPVREGTHVPVGGSIQVMPDQSDVALTLFATGQLEVSVSDATGHPIPDAHVLAGQMGPRARWGKTDQNGRLLIQDFPAGASTIEVTQAKVTGTSYKYIGAPKQDVVVEAGKLASASIALADSDSYLYRKVSARLIDSRGHPVLHASIHVCYKSDSPGQEKYRGTEWTQLDGFADIDLMLDDGNTTGYPGNFEGTRTPGEPGIVRITVGLEGYSEPIRISDPVSEGKRAYFLDRTFDWPKDAPSISLGDVVVDLPAERFFTVRPEHGGKRVSQAKENACTDFSGASVPFREISSTDNLLRFAVRHAGPVRLRLVDGFRREIELTIPEDSSADPPIVARFPPTRRIELTLEDEGGKLPSGFHLWSLDAGTTRNSWPQLDPPFSDDVGKFSFDVLPETEGCYVLGGALTHVPIVRWLKRGTEPLRETIRLKRSDALIIGRVLDADGKPRPDAKVQIGWTLWYDYEGRSGRFSTTTHLVEKDGVGGFSSAVPAGLSIRVQASEDWDRGSSDEVMVRPGDRLTLDVIFGKEGRELSPDGKSLEPGQIPEPQPAPLPEPLGADDF